MRRYLLSYLAAYLVSLAAFAVMLLIGISNWLFTDSPLWFDVLCVVVTCLPVLALGELLGRRPKAKQVQKTIRGLTVLLAVMAAMGVAGGAADTPRATLEQALAHCGWASNTVNTYLTRLKKKQFVSVAHERRGNRYTALVSQEDYLAFDSKTVLSQLYGTPRNFVAALVRGGVDRAELDQLRSLLDELEAKRND